MFGVAMEEKPSPRREVQLQGPRPTPLKVRKESHKIRKPPAGPSHVPPAAPPPRQPIIIYTVSPKVIHSTPGDFMTLVQRLTGPSPTPAAADAQPSPAARLAAYEKALIVPSSMSSAARIGDHEVADYNIINQLELPISSLDRSASGPGILSPMPTSLPPISPIFFSPMADPNILSFLHDLSPIFHGNRNYIENTFLSSPGAFTSPTPAFDLFFNQFP